MTVDALKALREKVLQQMAAPKEMRSGDDAISMRDGGDLQATLARLDQEIAQAEGRIISRSTYATHSRS